jgi:hypothetical protein
MTFWFRIDNGIISENMMEFGDFVYEKVMDVKRRKAETNRCSKRRQPIRPSYPIQNAEVREELTPIPPDAAQPQPVPQSRI